MKPLRRLMIVLGDQLDRTSALFDDFDVKHDRIWMAEVADESEHVWSHKARIALFLSAMRHFEAWAKAKQYPIDYIRLDDVKNHGSLAAELAATLAKRKPDSVVMLEAGDYRVWKAIEATCTTAGIPLEIRIDRHFLNTIEQFREHAHGRKQLRMEFFYREMRKRTGILMDGKSPVGGDWNYDAENRGSFGKTGPKKLPAPKRFLPDSITHEVLELVETRFAGHPGKLEHFDWPVTPEQAHEALADFITHRLPNFGKYQDAIWEGEPWLYHSRLSSSMNLKLLDPRTVIAAVEAAYHAGNVDLAGAEGFIRQILGWREYVRGIYWLHMPGYLQKNALKARENLPAFYWTGDTEMNCLREAITQTLDFGYSHHIQRLMVTGLYAMMLGVAPQQVHEWYLAVYVDAVEWVELPNTLGMSQYGDGGIMASKPYAATGKYIQRMSNACTGCRYDPAQSTGPDACPFTTLYWDFLMRHEDLLRANQRMSLQVKNIDRLDDDVKAKIREQAESHRQTCRRPNPPR